MTSISQVGKTYEAGMLASKTAHDEKWDIESVTVRFKTSRTADPVDSLLHDIEFVSKE